jgi:DNA-binding NarL/FixJ family response regulator
MICPHCGEPILMRPISSVLTPREWEILALLAEGRAQQQLASHLVVSNDTIRSHVKSIHKKLGMSTEEAIDWALHGGDSNGH